MRIGVITLFPDAVRAVGTYGVIGRAIEAGQVVLDVENPRDHATDTHRTVDDRPYGGGPGMVMKIEPLEAALAALKSRLGTDLPVVLLSPAGQRFDQASAGTMARGDGFILVAGRYEGIDERFTEARVDAELSIGDFVVSGGEIPAMAVIDAVVRLLPGVLGDAESAEQDSFADGLLDCPHYTRPEVIGERRVPEVLTSGDHAAIDRWRLKQALGRTFERRPDLIDRQELTDTQRKLLDEYLDERD